MKHANKVNMSFRYIPAASTDIAKTIARKKRELAEQKEREAAALAEAAA